MGRGACVPGAASGTRAQAGWRRAVLGALCLLPALALLAQLGAPRAGPAASAAQVSRPGSGSIQRLRPSGRESACLAGVGAGYQPVASSSAHCDLARR